MKDHEKFTSLLLSQSLKYISPNSFELKAMHLEAYQNGFFKNFEWSKEIKGNICYGF